MFLVCVEDRNAIFAGALLSTHYYGVRADFLALI